MLFDLGKHGVDLVRVRDIRLDDGSRAAGGADHSLRFLRALFIAVIIDENDGAVGCQVNGDRTPDAAGCAGDQRDRSFCE